MSKKGGKQAKQGDSKEAEGAPAASSGVMPTYTMEDVRKHNNAKDAWIVIHGKVYDVTKFLDDHPGGPEILLTKCGDDGTDAFEEVFHQEPARKQLKDFFIGRLHGYTGDDDAVFKAVKKADGDGASDLGSKLLFIIPAIIVIAAVAYQMLQ